MIKVFKIKDLIKYAIRILIPITIIFFLLKLTGNIKEKISEKKIIENIESNMENDKKENILLSCFDDTIKEIKKMSEKTDSNEDIENSDEFEYANNWTSIYKHVISSEFKVISNIKVSKDENNNNNNINTDNSQHLSNENEEQSTNQTELKQAETNVKTEVINSGINPRSTNEYNGVKINNSTNYTLTEEMLNPAELQINKLKIGIYHTHTCESYTPTEQYSYQASGTFRSIDLNFSVARVGDELTNQLISYGCNVIHDKTYHDYPAYNGSYSRSLKTAQKMVSENSDADIIIDLHRDAIADPSYAPKVKIGDEYVSQLMFVMGSNVANSINKNWNQNFKFAIKVQQKANELYPGLFKPIILRNSEYNQHVAKAACIIEVGATGNTLEESIGAMKYLAKVLEEF